MKHDDEVGDGATALLLELQGGDESAADELLPLIYAELHRMAQRALAKGNGHTLQTTDLMNEAWLKLVESSGAAWRSRDHFLAVAARAMRSVLVDRSRSRGALKRGGGRRAEVDLDAVVSKLEAHSTDLVLVDEALETLGRADRELARIVEMRFFGGMSHASIARALGVSLSTVERGWRSARAWLFVELRGTWVASSAGSTERSA